MKRPTFREATDALCLTAEELAELFHVKLPSIRQARMKPGSTGYRSPPPGWEGELAKIARTKGRELVKLAEALERAGES